MYAINGFRPHMLCIQFVGVCAFVFGFAKIHYWHEKIVCVNKIVCHAIKPHANFIFLKRAH